MLASVFLALMLAARTDETVQVQKPTRLDVQIAGGTIEVIVWNRDAVRVEADHEARNGIQIRTTSASVRVEGDNAGRGPERLTITVPAWMPIRILSRRANVTVNGVGGDAAVETISGNIMLRGGNGRVYAKSLQGGVTIENAKGTIEARAMNSRVRVAGVSGEIVVESTNGSLALEQVDATKLLASTVNGSVTFVGQFNERGVHRLSTHNGNLSLVIPEASNATLRVRTYRGKFQSTFPVRLEPSVDNGPTMLMLGNGAAKVDLESFNGSISLRRPTDPAPERRGSSTGERQRQREQERARERERQKEKNKE